MRQSSGSRASEFACFRHRVGFDSLRELAGHLREIHGVKLTALPADPPSHRPGMIGRPRTAVCGTQSGYARHLIDRTLSCRPCMEAHRVYQKARRGRMAAPVTARNAGGSPKGARRSSPAGEGLVWPSAVYRGNPSREGGADMNVPEPRPSRNSAPLKDQARAGNTA